MRRLTISCLVILMVPLCIRPAAYARGSGEMSLWGGYSHSSGTYLDRLAKEIPEPVERDQYAAGLDLWGGEKLQIGFTFCVNSVYSYDKTMKATRSGDVWSKGGADHSFELNYLTLPLLFNARLMLTDKLYIGGGTGYHIDLVTPKIDGVQYRRYGDMGISAQALAGYNLELTEVLHLGFSFRAIWGFEQKNVFVSYIPALALTAIVH
jgi:hypothetical protein